MINSIESDTKTRSSLSWFLFAIIFMFAWNSGAWAQDLPGGSTNLCTSDTLGGMFCVFQESSVAQLLLLVMSVAFISGLFLTYKGLAKLVKVADSQGGQEPLSSALLTLASGTFLTAFPATILVGLATFGADGPWNINLAGKVEDGGTLEGSDFMTLAANFAINAAGPLSTLVMAIAVLIGIIIVMSAMFDLAKMNSPQSRSPEMSEVAGKLLVGIALVNIFWVMDVIGASFGLNNLGTAHFTEIAERTVGYAKSAGATSVELSERMDLIMRIIFAGLIPFGLIAFVRGLLILKDSASGTRQASMGSGFTHIVGGVALVNAEPVSCAIMKTLSGAAIGVCGA